MYYLPPCCFSTVKVTTTATPRPLHPQNQTHQGVRREACGRGVRAGLQQLHLGAGLRYTAAVHPGHRRGVRHLARHHARRARHLRIRPREPLPAGQVQHRTGREYLDHTILNWLHAATYGEIPLAMGYKSFELGSFVLLLLSHCFHVLPISRYASKFGIMQVACAHYRNYSGERRGGGQQKTWSISCCAWWPSFVWLDIFFTGRGEGQDLPPPPVSAIILHNVFSNMEKTVFLKPSLGVRIVYI